MTVSWCPHPTHPALPQCLVSGGRWGLVGRDPMQCSEVQYSAVKYLARSKDPRNLPYQVRVEPLRLLGLPPLGRKREGAPNADLVHIAGRREQHQTQDDRTHGPNQCLRMARVPQGGAPLMCPPGALAASNPSSWALACKEEGVEGGESRKGRVGPLTAASKEAAGILRMAKRTASALGGGAGPEDALGNSTSTPAETAGTGTHQGSTSNRRL